MKKIINHECGEFKVDSYELFKLLGYNKKNHNRWINTVMNKGEENVDYIHKPNSGEQDEHKFIRLLLTVEFAKFICGMSYEGNKIWKELKKIT